MLHLINFGVSPLLGTWLATVYQPNTYVHCSDATHLPRASTHAHKQTNKTLVHSIYVTRATSRCPSLITRSHHAIVLTWERRPSAASAAAVDIC
jgi:hypothetical protein